MNMGNETGFKNVELTFPSFWRYLRGKDNVVLDIQVAVARPFEDGHAFSLDCLHIACAVTKYWRKIERAFERHTWLCNAVSLQLYNMSVQMCQVSLEAQ